MFAITNLPFVCAQSKKTAPRIKHFNLEEGLSQVSVNDLIKDNHGFVWIATADGLNRFDGKIFKHYKFNKSNPKSLQGSFINKLLYDHKGRMWIGTLSNGLSVLESNNSEFRKIYQKKDSLDVKNITSLESDNKNNLWIGSENEGLFRLNLDSLKEHEFVFDKPVTALKFDAENHLLWIGDINGNIYKLDADGHNKPEFVGWVKDHVRSFYITDSKLFVGGNEGLFKFNASKKIFEHKELENSGKFSTKYVSTFLKRDENTVWVGSGNGLYLYNLVDDLVEKEYEDSDGSKLQLTNNTIHCSLQISKNTILVGSASGLNLLDFNSSYFKNISKDKAGEQLLNDNVIFSIYKNDIGLWVGTSRGGLNLITHSRTYYYTHHQDSPNYIAAPTVRAIKEDKINKRLWLATSRGLSLIDLNNFNPEKPVIQNFYYEYENPNSISGNFLKDIAIDKSNNLWGASYGQGIFRFELDKFNNLKVVRYKHNKDKKNSLVDDVTQSLKFDSNNNLWIGTRNGLSKLSFKDKNYGDAQFENFVQDKNKPNSISNNSVYDIYEDINKNIWIGTRKGLNLFTNNSFENWTAQKQFPNDIVYIVQGDLKGNLWLGTNDGIVRFNSKNESFSHYGVSDNIQGKEFDIHASFKDNDNTIFLGGIDGITYFETKNFEEIDNPAQIYFSELRVKNKEQNSLTTSSEILNQGLVNIKNLQFKHDQLPFYLDVSSIDFRIHKSVEFAYRLLPQNQDWISLKDREIQFINLPSGDYKLQINGFSRGKEWNQEPLEMNIKVLPPPWATWGAYSLYALMVLSLIYMFYRFQLSKKLAVAESNKLKELNTLKSNLYTNITHEFRTPLTIILGLADTIKVDLTDRKYNIANEGLQIIERNGKDLLQLVNQLLGLSKVDSGTMELSLIKANVIPFVRYICESFESLAKKSNIEIIVYSEEEELIMDFDDSKLQMILSNLLSNAIKFSPIDENVLLLISVENVDNHDFLVLKVKDNGMGIPEKAIPYVFDRFYQVENSLSKAGKGTGIGLALTRELVSLMNGTISVKSKHSKGTEFKVTIPITRNLPSVTENINQSIDYISDTSLEQELGLKLFDTNTNLPKALIIEDNKDVAYYLKLCLQGKYYCIFATNGDLGLKAAFEKIPDIIICDVMMPGTNGLDVCKTLKTDQRTDHIPVILLTAKASKKDKLKGLEQGADAYLTKPFFKAELLTRLDQLVLLRKRMMQTFSKNKFAQIVDLKDDKPETKFLQKIIAIIHNDIDNYSFGSRHIAQKLRLSESQIYRKLKAITGKSTAVFIRSVRLEKAKEMLQTTNKTVSEIAYEVGFNDPSWFSRAFKEEFGQTPSDLCK